MIKKLSLALLSLIFLALLAGSALAATQQITVSAAVIGTCKFDGTSINALNLGDLTPGSALPASANGALNFWCTKNAAYTLTHDSTGNLTGATHAETIPYTFVLSSVAGTGDGPSAALDTTTVTATVAASVYDANSADAYEEIVTVTLNP